MPPDLRESAAQLAAQFRERARRHREEADRDDHLAAMLESQAAAEEERRETSTETVLHTPRKQSTVNQSDMVSEHRVAISKGTHGGSNWLRTIRKAGYSQNALAEAIGESASLLSKHRLPKSNPNHRPIKQAIADKVKDLTGWPADAAHWPAGIA